MRWFEADAPIRQKTLIAFASLLSLVAIMAILELLQGNWWMAAAGAIATGVGALLASQFREAICVPYVNTVVRMEALAAGDLASPINYTHYKDCVGRMTTAMFTFRDTALEQKRAGAEQAEVVATLRAALSRLTEGDLSGEITETFPESYVELKTNFNLALASLRELIGAVGETTDAIRTGSSEIAHASEDLARRTEANAASLEETSAAVTQMDGRLKGTAEAAGRTVERADGTIATVQGGRNIADEAMHAMTRVNDSAKGIDSVIEGLDKIAFQTRVLAMNAAVEAGRAGEAGRGFAVVADLVSALAMRAEEEAGRARDQLTATQTDIISAVEMVQKVDLALANISDDVAEVHVLLGEMAADNQAQSSAVTEISTAIQAMDQSTQQNAAMVEQTSAAARNLASKVEMLADQASRFDTGRAAPTPLKSKGPRHDRPSSGRPAAPALRSGALNGAGTPQLVHDDWTSF